MDDSHLGSHVQSTVEHPGTLDDDDDAHIKLLREWALSLSRPMTAPESMDEAENISHVLLRLPKRPLSTPTHSELAPFRATPEAPVETGLWQRGQWPPKVSQLGPEKPPWKEGRKTALAGQSKLSHEAAVAKQRALNRHRRPRSCTPAKQITKQIKEPFFHFESVKTPTPFTHGPAVLSSWQRPRQRHPTQGSGGDPLAGSPFGKDAQLDPLSQRLGIYDAQWVSSSRRFELQCREQAKRASAVTITNNASS